VAAHELLEALLSALPVGCLSSVIGYDGSVKIEPSRLARHVPARAESMLAGLWRLDGPAGAGAAEFLRFSRMLASAGEGKALLVLVTGQRALSAPDQEAAALHAQNVRVAVLHVGGGGGRRLLDSGKETAADMVLECPGRTAPWVPAFDLLSNLNWPVLRDVALDLEGQASGVILTAGSGLASQPVVAVISMPQGQGAVRGAFRAVAGSQRPTAVFEASPEVDAALDGRLADELVSDLK
jgi:hypothetical protein